MPYLTSSVGFIGDLADGVAIYRGGPHWLDRLAASSRWKGSLVMPLFSGGAG